MEIPIKIESPNAPALASQLFKGTPSLSYGTTTKAPGGIDITLHRIVEHRALDIPGVLEFVVETAVAIDVGLFSAWLYEKVKQPTKATITIKEREVILERGEIQKALEREIEING